jgi:methylated-DNA-[protein]-cysteine S-methyltransferase
LRCNPYAPIVPCHRVVSADGSIGGFMGKVKGKAIQKKITLLKKEGVKIKENKVESEIISFFSSAF